MARYLWRWREAVGLEGRRLLVEEARRLRAERDQAMEREPNPSPIPTPIPNPNPSPNPSPSSSPTPAPNQAMERERTLKRGLGALREERGALELQLRTAHEKAP